MNKKIIIDRLEIFYQKSGKGNQNILLLHGWGQSHAFWNDVTIQLKNKYCIYNLDLPGFGISQEPPNIWSFKRYAQFIHLFVKMLKINHPLIIGHSFGGRIAIVYASQFPVQKLILYSTGGLPEQSIRKKIYKQLINVGKYLLPNVIYKHQTTIFKPNRYQNKILVNKNRSRRMLDIYTQPFSDLKNSLVKITAKTLIIAGSKDRIIEAAMGKKLAEMIAHSQLIEIADAGHFAHFESPKKFFDAVITFLQTR